MHVSRTLVETKKEKKRKEIQKADEENIYSSPRPKQGSQLTRVFACH